MVMFCFRLCFLRPSDCERGRKKVKFEWLAHLPLPIHLPAGTLLSWLQMLTLLFALSNERRCVLVGNVRP